MQVRAAVRIAGQSPATRCAGFDETRERLQAELDGQRQIGVAASLEAFVGEHLKQGDRTRLERAPVLGRHLRMHLHRLAEQFGGDHGSVDLVQERRHADAPDYIR